MSTHQHKHTHPGESITSNRTGPTNAGQIEDNFVREIQRIFRRFRGLIRTTVGYDNNALELKQEDKDTLFVANSERRTAICGTLIRDNGLYTYVQSASEEQELVKTPAPFDSYVSFHSTFGSGLTSNADPRERFEFTTRQELISKFMRWVSEAINEEILEPLQPTENVENHWASQFIRTAYLKGTNQAIGLLFQQGVSVDNPPGSEILSRPISQSSLQTLYTRNYENLKDITDDMADQIRERLTEGFARGHNPRKMADRLTKEIRDIQRTRAETLARTEVMHGHSTAMLDEYEQSGVSVVTHAWDAANDDRTCPFCERLDGVKLSTEEVRTGAVSWSIEPDWKDQIWRLQPPAHPNCRCVLKPLAGASVPVTPLSERVHDQFEERASVLA